MQTGVDLPKTAFWAQAHLVADFFGFLMDDVININLFLNLRVHAKFEASTKFKGAS